jgi:demethylmenaquinone methyltransferase / 2-methoxy-6-polyprenyl-1,4-benzoquinol methylase
MANKFYDPGAQRAARVAALFARIAARYDLINDLQSFGLHRLWKRRLVALAEVRPGAAALDLCCGTGDLAFELARRGAHVTGLDFSPAMLDVARRRAGGRPGDVEFLTGDAMHLPLADNAFDIVTMGYGLRNLADWETGLREMIRVAKPGGRVLVLEFGKPDNGLWRGIYFTYLRLFVPLLGRVFCGDAAAYAYILESLQHYPAQRGLAARMESLGLRSVRTVNLLGGVMSINGAVKPPVARTANSVANGAAA